MREGVEHWRRRGEPGRLNRGQDGGMAVPDHDGHPARFAFEQREALGHR